LFNSKYVQIRKSVQIWNLFNSKSMQIRIFSILNMFKTWVFLKQQNTWKTRATEHKNQRKTQVNQTRTFQKVPKTGKNPKR
jgi:hypothetical protein